MPELRSTIHATRLPPKQVRIRPDNPAPVAALGAETLQVADGLFTDIVNVAFFSSAMSSPSYMNSKTPLSHEPLTPLPLTATWPLPSPHLSPWVAACHSFFCGGCLSAGGISPLLERK